jgi:hypothetical protein
MNHPQAGRDISRAHAAYLNYLRADLTFTVSWGAIARQRSGVALAADRVALGESTDVARDHPAGSDNDLFCAICATAPAAVILDVENTIKGLPEGWCSRSCRRRCALTYPAEASQLWDAKKSLQDPLDATPSPEAKFENVPEGLHPVLPTNLLSFGIGPSKVANAKLINAKVALAGDLGAHLYFDPEIIRSQPQ